MATFLDPLEHKRYLESLGEAGKEKLAALLAEWRSGTPWTTHEDIALCQVWAQGPRACAALLQRTAAACSTRGTKLGIAGGARRWSDRLEWLGKIEERDECIVGWRIWRVLTNGRDAILRSVHTGHPWPAGSPMEAHRIDGAHTGIHAYKTLVQPEKYGYQYPPETHLKGEQFVYGQIALWGRVIEHEDGYRAQFGYPLKIHAAYLPLARIIARCYGIEAVHTMRQPYFHRTTTA